MLYSAEIIGVVADFFAKPNRPPLVVDPVMVATSGAALLKPSAIRILQERLLPLATLITPNVDEAALLLGRKKARSVRELESAARAIHKEYGCAVVVKGGHLPADKFARDVYFDGENQRILRSGWVKGVSTHGTGCTYSAGVAAHLAHGHSLARSAYFAKRFITRAIASSYAVGAHTVLDQSGGRRI
jgi:hydroxymethylpyrimidine/phosphomethylpyrimidine kinase